MTSTASPVAASPFLSVEQVAIELGITSNLVHRLIALKALEAHRTNPIDGRWVVMPDALAKYVMRGAPRSTVPKLDLNGDWYELRDLRNFAGFFETEVRNWIAAQAPAVNPIDRPENSRNYDQPLRPGLLSPVKAIGSQPAEYWARMPGEKPPTLPTRADQFIAHQLIVRVEQAAEPTVNEGTKSLLTTWMKLYDSPESYRRYVDAAWATIQKAKFSVTKQYPVEGAGGTWCSVSFTVPFTVFAVKLADVEPLVF